MIEDNLPIKLGERQRSRQEHTLSNAPIDWSVFNLETLVDEQKTNFDIFHILNNLFEDAPPELIKIISQAADHYLALIIKQMSLESDDFTLSTRYLGEGSMAVTSDKITGREKLLFDVKCAQTLVRRVDYGLSDLERHQYMNIIINHNGPLTFDKFDELLPADAYCRKYFSTMVRFIADIEHELYHLRHKKYDKQLSEWTDKQSKESDIFIDAIDEHISDYKLRRELSGDVYDQIYARIPTEKVAHALELKFLLKLLKLFRSFSDIKVLPNYQIIFLIGVKEAINETLYKLATFLGKENEIDELRELIKKVIEGSDDSNQQPPR